jgi:hypothetical protein
MQVGGGGDQMEYVVFRHDGERYSDDFDHIKAKRIRGRWLIGKNWHMSTFGPMPKLAK